MADVISTLWKWTPLLSQGFMWNLIIGMTAMGIGTLFGVTLGTSLVLLKGPARRPFWILTQILRNSPWLVLFFFVMYLTPYRTSFGGTVMIFPAWLKAAAGLSLPAAGYIAEITR